MESPVKGLRVRLDSCGGGCPFQLQGRTEDGRYVYGRYRGGTLSFGIGASEWDAVGTDTFVKGVGGWLDGYMSLEEFVKHTGIVIVPESE